MDKLPLAMVWARLPLGIATRLEVIAILMALPEWTNDVPSLRQAWALRRGQAMQRSKLFNG